MRTFCSLTWRVREGRFPDTIMLGNSGSVVCSILLQGEKIPCKTPRKSKFNSCSTGQTCKAYVLVYYWLSKKIWFPTALYQQQQQCWKKKSKPDNYKLLFIFPWLHPPSSPERLSTLTVNLKISHLYKLSPLQLYVREREMHASSRTCTQYQCNQMRQNMFKPHQTVHDLLFTSNKGDYSDLFAMIGKIHTSISCLP